MDFWEKKTIINIINRFKNKTVLRRHLKKKNEFESGNRQKKLVSSIRVRQTIWLSISLSEDSKS